MSTEIKKHMSMHEEETPEDLEENQGFAETVPLQALQFIRAELLKTQKSIKDLQSERRMLRKQLSRWAGAVQVLQETQEEGHSRLEAKIQALNESSECMRTELQQLKHNVQKDETTVSELHPGKLTTRCNEYLPSKVKSRLSPANEKGTPPGSKLRQGVNGKILQMSNSDNWRVDDLSETENPIYRNQNVWNSFQPSCQTQHDYLKVQNKNTLLHMRHLCESLKAAESFKHQERTGGDRHTLNSAQLRPLKFTKSGGLNTCSSMDAQKEQATTNNEEEEELHELVEKLKDALSAQIRPGNHHGLKQEFLYAAQQVCRSYSDLINQTIEPTLK